jgi:hypothetical protein
VSPGKDGFSLSAENLVDFIWSLDILEFEISIYWRKNVSFHQFEARLKITCVGKN